MQKIVFIVNTSRNAQVREKKTYQCFVWFWLGNRAVKGEVTQSEGRRRYDARLTVKASSLKNIFATHKRELSVYEGKGERMEKMTDLLISAASDMDAKVVNGLG